MSQREAWDRWHARGEVESTSPGALFNLHHAKPRKGSKFLDVGVGVGDMVRAVLALGATVDAVDISPLAGEGVKDLVRRFYLADEVDQLPEGEYHLALSHLVAQHTEDDDFAFQAGHVFRALRPRGVYSIQFAGSRLGAASRVHPSAVEVGHMVRSPEEAIALCERACPGAAVTIAREPESLDFTNTGPETFYYYLHVTKSGADA